mgnify:CR=1 FL=1
MKLESRVESVQLECSESLIVHTGVAGRDVCSLLAVYRSPSGAAGRFLGDFSVCLSSLPAHSFVVGDLDIDLNPENFLKNSALDYDYFLNKFGFFNVTESPTRFWTSKNSLIDHILTNKTKCHFETPTIVSDFSDHLPICAAFELNKISETGIKDFNINIIDFEKVEKNLHSTDWNNVSTAQNFDTAFERFIANLQNEIKVSSEIKTIRRSKRRSSTFKHPWMTPELYQLTEKRRKLLRLSQNQPLNESLQL